MSTITSPATATSTNGQFSYLITANNTPVRFDVTGAPGGLRILQGGYLAGPVSPGVYTMGLTATNAAGDVATGSLTLTATAASAATTPSRIFLDEGRVVRFDNPDGTSPATTSATGANNGPPLLTRVNSTAYENSHVLKPAPGKLVHLRGYSKKASAGYIMLFDAAAQPANGVTNWVNIQLVPGPGNFSFDLPYEVYASGIVVCNSTTDASLTLGAADCWFTANVF